MSRLCRLLAAVTVAILVAVTGAGSQGKGKGGGGSSSDAVIITFRDASSDLIASDGGGSYQDGVDRVITSLSGLAVTLPKNGAHRAVFFQFSDCVSSCGETPFLSQTTTMNSGWAVLTQDESALASNGLLGIPVGEERPIIIKLYLPDLPDDDWTVCFYPPAFAATRTGICSFSTQGTAAHARRIDESSWEIFATAADSASLIKGVLGKRATASEKGAYSMPFSMTVTCVDASACPVLPENP